MKRLGLYIHIPFCINKCLYCDFNSKANTNDEDHRAYMSCLASEIGYYSDKSIKLDSIYIGGGTPSLIEAKYISGMMDVIRDGFVIDEAAEITIEANPGTLNKDKLIEYLRSGINRLSLGIQSMDDELLTALGRIHSSDDNLRNYTLARECGFKNINTDLIFAIPGQSVKDWEITLKKIVDLNPEHLSFYSLQIEEGTPFFNLWKEGVLHVPDDETDRIMYHKALQLIEREGYIHYEISNASKYGYESRHNMKYWSMEEYLGVGLGAHSYIGGTRFSNETDLSKYINDSNEISGKHIPGIFSPYVAWTHKNTSSDNMAEYLFTGLRKVEGVSISAFEDKFFASLIETYGKSIAKHEKNGFIKIDFNKDRLWLTSEGMDIFNRVLVDFI